MDELERFAGAHMPIIGPTLAFVAAWVVVLVTYIVRRRRSAKRAREDVRIRGLSIAELRSGAIAIRATYRARDGRRWLESSGQRVELVGEVEIVRGTSVRWSRGQPTYALRDGAQVIAMGAMTYDAHSGESTATFRDAAGGWSLGKRQGPPVELCAVKPAVTPRPLGVVATLLVVASATAAIYGALYVTGVLDWTGMLRAIPGASVERWSTALDAVCTNKDIGPEQEVVMGRQRAATAIRYRCAQSIEGDILFDSRGRVSFIDIGTGRAMDESFVRALLSAYRVRVTAIDALVKQMAVRAPPPRVAVDGMEITIVAGDVMQLGAD